jgi:hypothetical protein
MEGKKKSKIKSILAVFIGFFGVLIRVVILGIAVWGIILACLLYMGLSRGHHYETYNIIIEESFYV